MANILLTADWHLTDKPQDAYRFGLVDWIVQNYAAWSVDAVVIMGDLTDQKDRHSARFVNQVVQSLSSLASHLRVVVLRGNHDCIDPSHPFFGFLEKIPNLQYIADCADYQFGRNKVGLVAHQSDLAALKSRLDGLADDPSLRLLCMHQTMHGAMSSNGFALEGLSDSVFGGLACPIWSGDVHVPQKLGKVQYVGAPYHVHFGDAYQPRCVVWSPRRVQDVHYPSPKRLVWVIRCQEDLRQLQLEVGDQVKVRIQLPRERYDLWSTLKAGATTAVEQAGGSVQVVELVPLTPKVDTVPKKPVVQAAHPSQLVEQFCAKEHVADGIKETGLALLEAETE